MRKVDHLKTLHLTRIMESKVTNSDVGGIPFTNRFLFEINAPASLGSNGFLEFQVISADIPNISIDPTELELNGAKRFVFKGRIDSDLGITFLDTPQLDVRRFFYRWLQMAITVSEGVGTKRSYMEDYTASEFSVFQLDNRGNATWGDRFINIFPYDISNISFNYAQGGEVLKTTVKFKYMYHTIVRASDKNNHTIEQI